MNIREQVVAVAPEWALKRARSVFKALVGRRVQRYDATLFRRYRLRRVTGANLSQLEGKLTFHAHAIEKGLSHSVLRPHFGRTALTQLAFAMEEYSRQGYGRERRTYKNALSAIGAYAQAHRELGLEPSLLSEIFDEVTLAYAESSSDDLAGVTVLEGSSKKDNGVKNFKALFEGRYSVREFADGPLSVERILPALNLSRKAPSVCNRQASRVKIVTDAVLIDKVLKIQGGMTGYATPPALLVVTTDLAAFLEPTERNQPFIDGGIYTMALLLALEHEELAACPLNAMMTGRNEDRVKSLLGIPVSERLIVFLAVGEFPRSVKVPMSFRLPVDDVVRLPVDDVVSHISE